MFKWLLNKYRTSKMKNHIGKQSCFVFPVLDKSLLEDGMWYETFDFEKDWDYRHKEYSLKISTKHAKWNAEFERFIDGSKLSSYEDFKPLREAWQRRNGEDSLTYGITSYNPCDITPLDLEEIKNITFNLSDDNTESDEIWEKLINYFDERGLND